MLYKPHLHLSLTPPHIDIAQEHRKYLGFTFVVLNTLKYFVFASLPFGLSTASFVFTKVLRPLVVHWRFQAHNLSSFWMTALKQLPQNLTVLHWHLKSQLICAAVV